MQDDEWLIHDGLQSTRRLVEGMDSHKVVLVGDVMLDRFIYGYANNLNPRAPVPVLKETHREQGAGAAAHVARGLNSLKFDVQLHGVVADDEAGQDLLEALEEEGLSSDHIAVLEDWRTTVKTRMIASRESLIENKQMMLRLDEESLAQVPSNVASLIAEQAISALSDSDALIISDYGKGVVDDATADRMLEAAKSAGVPVICDPKLTGLHRTTGADVVIFESRGLELMRRRLSSTSAEKAAWDLIEQHGWQSLLVLGGQNGVDLYRAEEFHIHVSCTLHEPRQQIGLIDAAVVAVVAASVLGLSHVDMTNLVNAACECILKAEDVAHHALDRKSLCTRLDEIAWGMQISQR